MLKFISRAGKSAMRGLLPRDVKRNTLDNPIGLEACNMQQFWRTQPLFLFGFESQRSLASWEFASRASIFEAFLNPWEPRKNSFFLWVFRNFQKRFPFQENNYEVHFLQDRKPQWRKVAFDAKTNFFKVPDWPLDQCGTIISSVFSLEAVANWRKTAVDATPKLLNVLGRPVDQSGRLLTPLFVVIAYVNWRKALL